MLLRALGTWECIRHGSSFLPERADFDVGRIEKQECKNSLGHTLSCTMLR